MKFSVTPSLIFPSSLLLLHIFAVGPLSGKRPASCAGELGKRPLPYVYAGLGASLLLKNSTGPAWFPRLGYLGYAVPLMALEVQEKNDQKKEGKSLIRSEACRKCRHLYHSKVNEKFFKTGGNCYHPGYHILSIVL
ncbi:hypothetical protein [Desulforamulus putei]|uniref:hypothetical protein n=1 Tax=Desulforamulus putei TaxID=74701 RepID=UPI002FDD0CD7